MRVITSNGELAPTDHGPVQDPKPLSVGMAAAILLDIVIALYALVVVSVVIFGGFDIGFASATTASKAILILVLVVPVRAVLPLDTWAGQKVAAAWRHVGADNALSRIPAPARDVIFALAVTRIATFIIGFVANILLTPHQSRPFSIPVRWPKFMETFAIFDSGWYFDIASRGYYFSADAQSSVAFFPLYPLLMRLVAAPFDGSPQAVWLAGIAVSWIAFALALLALHDLTERMTGSREVARRTVLYLAVFPFSIYFTRVYTEALFLLVTVLAFRAGVAGRWAQAGCFGALAAATRPNGVFIAIPLMLLACGGRPAIAVLLRRAIALAPIPLAVIAYSGYVYTLTGNPLAWLQAQDHWGYTLGNPPYRHLLTTLAGVEEQGLYAWLLHSAEAPYEFVYAVLAVLFLGLSPAIIRRFGWAFGVWVLIGVLLPLSGNVLVGMGRYTSVLFPAFMVAATLTSARVHEALLILSCLFRAFFLALFVTWHPLH